jgi:hypothetical protein
MLTLAGAQLTTPSFNCVWMPLVLCSVLVTSEPAVIGNVPPRVEVVFPRPPVTGFSSGYVRLQAAAYDLDGTVEYVKFFVGTNLVGVSATPPYSAVWTIPWIANTNYATSVKAVAVDDLGATGESSEVQVFVNTLAQVHPLFELLSPRDGEVFSAAASFAFAIRLLVSAHPLDAPPSLPVAFLIGTNVVYASNDSPYSMIVTNLPPGDYRLSVIEREALSSGPVPITIHVAQCAFQPPNRMPDGPIRFGGFNVLNSNVAVVQVSTNLTDWVPLQTNMPPAQSFYILEDPQSRARAFYRILSRPP